MLEDVRNLERSANQLWASLRKLTSKQVTQKEPRDEAKTIVDKYFRNVRQSLVDRQIDLDFVSYLDGIMHALLEATHKNTSLLIFRRIVRDMQETLFEAEKLSLMASSAASHDIILDTIDKKILQTLKGISTSAALSYEQALVDMRASERMSWRGPASDLREALRELLDELAPDKEVETASGFRLEPNTNRPTMKQKTQHILMKRRLARKAIKSVQESVAIVEEMVGSFVRSVYTRASISTHTPTDKSEVIRIRNQVRTVLCELLEIS
jgi:hypothetical protein